jgi:CheY-like chemotaxis protein
MRAAPGSVLLVSSEAALAEGLHRALERQGVPSIVTANSVDAVQRLSQDAPAAIVVDLHYTEMDPEQIVHRALACRETHGSPIVVLAGADADAEGLLESGCNAVLRRDAEPRDLARHIAALLPGPSRTE